MGGGRLGATTTTANSKTDLTDHKILHQKLQKEHQHKQTTIYLADCHQNILEVNRNGREAADGGGGFGVGFGVGVGGAVSVVAVTVSVVVLLLVGVLLVMVVVAVVGCSGCGCNGVVLDCCVCVKFGYKQSGEIKTK